MDKAAALRLAEEAFPRGPERVADSLGAKVLLKSINVDGWCLRPVGRPPLITLNADSPETRRRFTLAHEVAHLILGTPPEVVVRRNRDLYDPKGSEEKEANQLASEMLLPFARVRPLFTGPIDARAITSVAERAGVSEVVLALRLMRNASMFGLTNPLVAKIEDGTVAWKIPLDRLLSDSMAARFYTEAVENGGTIRASSASGEPLLVCAMSNPTYPLLFIHTLPAEYSHRETPAEKRRRLETELFSHRPTTRQQMNGCFGAFKPTAVAMTFSEAVQAFYERYQGRFGEWFEDDHPSEAVSEYIALRIAEWMPDAPPLE